MAKYQKYYQYVMDVVVSSENDYAKISELYKKINVFYAENTYRKGHKDKKRGNLPSAVTPKNFYEAIIESLYPDNKKLKDFSEILIINLLDDKVFPSKWDSLIFKLRGNSPDFDSNEFKRFIIDLLANNTIEQQGSVKESSTLNASPISFEINYFPQTITNSVGKDFFNIKKADFSLLKRDRLILVEGEGGLGKSLFIKKLSHLQSSQREFDNIITLSLAHFVDYISHTNALPSTMENIELFASYLSNVCTDSDMVKIFNKTTETLLLLDGYDEAYSFGDSNSKNTLVEILQDIKENYNNIAFIVTTRPSEGIYNLKNSKFLKDFNVYYLSGVSDEAYDEFCRNHTFLPKDILGIAKIPLYYCALNKTEDLSTIKNENDLLKEIYFQNYIQASKKTDSAVLFEAYYLLAPAIANYMHTYRKPYVNNDEIIEIARLLFQQKNRSTSLLRNIVLEECSTAELPSNDYNEICKMFIHNGPLKSVETVLGTHYTFFHEEIKKYLICLFAWANICATKKALFLDDFSYMENLKPNLNLNSETVHLLKEKLKLNGQNTNEICQSIVSFFDVKDLENENIPQQVIFYHNVFLFSEYFKYGTEYLSTIYEILLPISTKAEEIIINNDAEFYLYNLSEQAIEYCKVCYLDILCKLCQYYRTSAMFDEGRKCIELAEKNQSSI